MSETGIEVRHSRYCPTREGGTCTKGRKRERACRPVFSAWIYSPTERRKIRRNFPTEAAAKSWRASAKVQLDQGRLTTTPKLTLREAHEAWQMAAEADPPTVLARHGAPYKPSVLRGYRADMANYVLPELGGRRLGDIRRRDLQALADRMLGQGLSAAKVLNVLMPLRVLFRWHIERDHLSVNPTANLRLPRAEGQRERAASASEAADLLAALPEDERPLWAAAFYAGLRLGELRGLRWSDVDLAAGTIRVARAIDGKGAVIAPKSKKGERSVPMSGLLRDLLDRHKLASGREDDDLVFGSRPHRPFTPSNIRRKAKAAWAVENAKRREQGRELLEPIGLHEGRHTFVSLWAAAGVPLERLGDYVGHSSTWMLDRYRHLIEGQAATDAELVDLYLSRADTAARVAQLDRAAA